MLAVVAVPALGPVDMERRPAVVLAAGTHRTELAVDPVVELGTHPTPGVAAVGTARGSRRSPSVPMEAAASLPAPAAAAEGTAAEGSAAAEGSLPAGEAERRRRRRPRSAFLAARGPRRWRRGRGASSCSSSAPGGSAGR